MRTRCGDDDADSDGRVSLILGLSQVGRLIRQLEKEMAVKQLKITDLLKELDTNGDGSVSASELEQG